MLAPRRKPAAIKRQFNQYYNNAIDQVDQKALSLSIALFRESEQISFAPIRDGKTLDDNQFTQLPQADRDLFNMLLGVDGVGPKVALSVLSSMSIDAVQRAVFAEEGELFSRVPGVGKKTAQKIALHLKDKLKPLDALTRVAAMTDADSEVLAAFTALGYSVVEAQSAIQFIPKDSPDDAGERGHDMRDASRRQVDHDHGKVVCPNGEFPV